MPFYKTETNKSEKSARRKSIFDLLKKLENDELCHEVNKARRSSDICIGVRDKGSFYRELVRGKGVRSLSLSMYQVEVEDKKSTLLEVRI